MECEAGTQREMLRAQRAKKLIFSVVFFSVARERGGEGGGGGGGEKRKERRKQRLRDVGTPF
jgi:hypothetical protein